MSKSKHLSHLPLASVLLCQCTFNSSVINPAHDSISLDGTYYGDTLLHIVLHEPITIDSGAELQSSNIP